MTIDIKNIQGETRVSVPIQVGSKGVFTLMNADYIQLSFSSENVIPFKLGDYTDLSEIEYEGLGGKIAKVYEIVDMSNVNPTYNNTTGAYDYKIRMDAYYWKWKNKIFKYTPENAGQEASWSLTAALEVHLGVFLRNLKALGYTYKGTEFTFAIDSTVENKAVPVTYDNINLLDALFTLASENYYDCDCWITDNVIHFGRNEYGDLVKIERNVEADSITKSQSKGKYATRIYAFGSTRNIPTNYRPTTEQSVVNGVVQKRLMLPEDTPYIDAYPDMTTEEAIEGIVVFDDIYPRRVGTISSVTTVDRDVVEGEEIFGTFKAYQYKDTGLIFKEDYRIEGQELKITFQSGKMNGMEFAVQFNPNNSDPSEQLWEIIRNEDYGRPLPDDLIKPENGDKYILSGFDIQLVSDQYIPAAEEELKLRAQKYADIAKKDDGTYKATLYSDYVYADQLTRNYEFGQRVNLIDDSFFENGRESRIIGWEINLDIPFDSPVYTIGESMPYSRIGEIEDKVDSLTYKGQTYTGGGGGGVYVIRTNDSTAPSDSNVFSASRSLATFLRKDKPDQTEFLVKFLKGIELGKFVSGLIGTGGAILVDTDGNSHAEVDYLTVRKKAAFTEIDVQELRHIGGSLIISPAAMVVSGVEETTDGYKCYFETEDSDGKKIYNEFVAGDQGRCQTFNLEKQNGGQIGNRYWWRLVTEVGEDYVVFSKTDCDVNSDIPQAGDNVAQLGNRTDTTRQNAQVYSAYGSDAPSRKMYQGINSYSLVGKDIKSEYYGTTTGRFKDVTYGDFYVGDRKGNTYLQYDQEEGVGIKGKVDVTYGSTGAANFNDLPEEVQKAAHVGSVNLLLNSGFTGNYETDDLESNTRLTSDYEMYSRALLNWTGTATVQEDVSAKSGRSATIGSISQSVELIEGEYYVISFKAKGTSVTVSCGSYSVSQSLRNEYTRYVFKFTHSGTNVFLISGNATVCDLQLERGTIATDWKPSPLDNDKSMAEFQALQYIAGAIKDGSVDIAGGLILANMLMLGNYKDGVLQKVTAVISGIYNDDDDVAAAFGGNYEQAIYTVMKYKENPLYVPTEEELLSMAKAVITHGGRAIFNDVVVRGYIYALGGFFRGKIETATDGTRIEINPETNSLCMYNQDNRLVLRLNFSTEELSTGAINYYPSLRMYKYSDSKLVSTTTLGTQNLQFSTYIDKDLYDVSLSALTGLTFAKNGEITKVFGPEYEINN